MPSGLVIGSAIGIRTEAGDLGNLETPLSSSSSIPDVASGSAYQPVPHMAAYGASKAYVLMLSEAL
jgi:NAD(P)-dependent dehydrogenase (short-subunit alcohol dehydrogenase family)